VVQRYPFWWIKLGDFGISKRVINDETALRTEIGTPSYLAPEVVPTEDSVGQSSYTNAVDMWSLGCVMYWVLTRAVPFSAREPAILINFIRDGSLFPIEKLHDARVSDEAIDFLKQLIVVQPLARMSAAKALEHPWLGVLRNTQAKARIESSRLRPDIRYYLFNYPRSSCSPYSLDRAISSSPFSGLPALVKQASYRISRLIRSRLAIPCIPVGTLTSVLDDLAPLST
jgi:serine/threonine protein kinase